MKAEKLIAKGVEKKFDGQQLWFSVESLNEHYKGVKYHESDLDESGFIKASDIFGDDIQEIEVEPIEVDETPEVEFNEGSVSEVAETKVPDGLVKADYIDEAVETIEEIIPAKVVKTKADKK